MGSQRRARALSGLWGPALRAAHSGEAASVPATAVLLHHHLLEESPRGTVACSRGDGYTLPAASGALLSGDLGVQVRRGGGPALQSCPRGPTTYKAFTGLSPTLPCRGPRASTFPETRAEGSLCWSGSPGPWDLWRVGGQNPPPQLTRLMPAATKHREPGQRRDCQLRWGRVTGTSSR